MEPQRTVKQQKAEPMTGHFDMASYSAPPPKPKPEVARRFELLSQREQEVLRSVAYGYTNREIAEHLGISVKSVETYRYRLSDKLDFHSRAELVRFALDLGLLRADDDGLPEVGVDA